MPRATGRNPKPMPRATGSNPKPSPLRAPSLAPRQRARGATHASTASLSEPEAAARDKSQLPAAAVKTAHAHVSKGHRAAVRTSGTVHETEHRNQRAKLAQWAPLELKQWAAELKELTEELKVEEAAIEQRLQKEEEAAAAGSKETGHDTAAVRDFADLEELRCKIEVARGGGACKMPTDERIRQAMCLLTLEEDQTLQVHPCAVSSCRRFV